MKKKALRFAAALGIVGAALIPGTAAHADYGTVDPNNSGGDPGSNSGNLPNTGSDAMAITLVGAGLAAGGVVLVRTNRRRSAAA